MDTTESNIVFDEKGWCDHCNNFYENIQPHWNPNEQGQKDLEPIVDSIKKHGKNKEFDCIIGVSGGLDSSYLVHLAVEELGLRPLIFHVDAGWNTKQSVNNIEVLIDKLDVELYTEVVNWEEMKDVQRSFFKAGVPDLDIPQDAVFFSALYRFAVKHKVKYVLTGANYAAESIREPVEWGGYYIDERYIRDLHKRFGKIKLRTFPLQDVLVNKLYYTYFRGMKVVKPLNYFPFTIENAKKELSAKYGWQPYAHKHHESRFTRFIECYWQPGKFGFDHRRGHFSSMILAGQISREEALVKLSKPAVDEQTMKNDFEYIAHKLDFTVEEFQTLFDAPNRTFQNYRNTYWLIQLGKFALNFIGSERRLYK